MPLIESAGVSIEHDGPYRILRLRSEVAGAKRHDNSETVWRIGPEAWAWLIRQ